ncbi:MAG: hypothetical protein LBB84_00985 [Tannerellaceae bacterium]|jgi:Cu/Ag efflux pump CusA|nr:hypothetical protein [Tannerellaceae bacterium]
MNHNSGCKFFYPILNATIFAILPLLFSSDMGSELQKPFSVAMIATVTVGSRLVISG